MDWLRSITDSLKPIKSLFGFYMLMFLIPLIIPFYFARRALIYIFVNNDFNLPIMVGLVTCVVIIILWTLFFLFYFTKERTRNPRLYGKGFVAGFSRQGETATSAESKSKQV